MAEIIALGGGDSQWKILPRSTYTPVKEETIEPEYTSIDNET